MPLLSISAAARAAGKNRATISRHIKEGRLTATTDTSGNVAVDTSELLRVYGGLATDGATSKQVHAPLHSSSEDATKDQIIAMLQQALENAREREQWLKKRIEHMEQLALPPGNTKSSGKGFFSTLTGLFKTKGDNNNGNEKGDGSDT